jgi:hypothetical protein
MKTNNYSFLFLIFSINFLFASCNNELANDGIVGARFYNESLMIAFKDSNNVEIKNISNMNSVLLNYTFDRKTYNGRIYGKPNGKSYNHEFNLIKSETDINKSKIILENEEFYFNEKLSDKKFVLNNSIKIPSFKKYLPFTEDPCINLEGVYEGVVHHLLTKDLLIYTLKEDKTEFYDGTVSAEIRKFRERIEVYNGVYRKIGEEVEIELFEKNNKTRKGLKKFRIERDKNGCVIEIYDGLVLKRTQN